MAGEHHRFEKKSLRKVLGKTANWQDLADSCVAFAAADGGEIHIGIEDADENPPHDQNIPDDLPTTICRRIRELTVNVSPEAIIQKSANGGSFVRLNIPRAAAIPSTSTGRYYLREGNANRPISGDDFLRLFRDRTMLSWEALTSAGIPRAQLDHDKLTSFAVSIRASDRVTQFIKDKADVELLDHYGFADGPLLTNFGILFVGRRFDRMALGTARSSNSSSTTPVMKRSPRRFGATTTCHPPNWSMQSGIKFRIFGRVTKSPTACSASRFRLMPKKSCASYSPMLSSIVPTPSMAISLSNPIPTASKS
jgi:Putative DNA-binding domain